MGFRDGITLLELLIALFIVAILSSVSMPALQNRLAQHRSNAVVRELVDAVALARTLAVSGGEVVTLCRSENGKACGGQWLQGMILFTDKNADREVNQQDSIRQYFSFPDAGGSLHWRAFGNRQYIQFNNLGFTRNQNGSFIYCPANKKPELARQLIINRTARVRLGMDSDGDGIREDSSGRPIRCP